MCNINRLPIAAMARMPRMPRWLAHCPNLLSLTDFGLIFIILITKNE